MDTDNKGLPENSSTDVNNFELVKQAIEENAEGLARAIRIFIWNSGVRNHSELTELAQEILQDTVVTALKIVDRYDHSRSAHAWLVGIAIKHTQARQRKQHLDNTRVVAISDYVTPSDDTELSESEMFDLLANPELASNTDSLNEILALVSESDREILYLSFVGRMKTKDLAEHLEVNEGTAYMRLYRALSRLHEAYSKFEQ